MKTIVVALAFSLFQAVAQAQVMKCVAANGKVEFATTCPPGTKAENTGIRNAPAAAPSAPSAQQKSLAELEADFRKRQVEQQEAAKKAEEKNQEAADRKQNCESARSYLSSLQSGNRIGKIDPKTGERVFLEDSERAAETARAQRAVDTNCK
jgi:hypothetical protein